MAIIKQDKVTPKTSAVRHEGSHLRQAARRAGIEVPKPKPALTGAEQEEADCY